MRIAIVICFAFALGVARGQEIKGEALYQNNFEKAEVGKSPEDFMVLEGAFAVREENGNKFFELAGAPLDGYGVLFGPNEASNIVVSARIFGSAQGQRFPTFGVGLNGVAGYKLQVAPGKRTLDLYKGEEVVASTPYAWEPGTWTVLNLRVRKVKVDEWKVEGRAWKEGAKTPQNWAISFTDKALPAPGRPSAWGAPISGKPIRFDDFVVSRVKE
jgi:hypothetical protein